ncbi:MAG TPA: glycoside hydrolase family 172 protein [Puia sp.]|nr:glycoside hydrolase family 172 protein [Puia sp.]
MRRNLLFLFLLAGYAGPGACQDIISVKSLLEEMTSASSVAIRARPAYVMKQASSYDRRSIGPGRPGWFANGDFNQYIRTESNNGHVEYVMMDAGGPGAIVRFWLTSLTKAGKLRFYFDNEPQASVEIPAYDLLQGGFNLGPALLNPHSSYEPKGKGGSTMYLPMPYQKHCKITIEYPDTVTTKTPHYYQINYRTYTAGTRVKTFSKADLARYKATIDQAEAVLWRPPVYNHGKQIKEEQPIEGHKEMSFSLPGGAAAIRLLTIRVTTSNREDLAEALRNVILKIVADGSQTVLCPVGDFSGSGYGGKVIKSWYRDLNEDGTIVSRWVMPYQRDAQITLMNKGPFVVNAAVAVTVDKWTWDTHSMYFHASYKCEKDIKDAKWDYDARRVAAGDTAAPIEWNFIKIRGRGIYLGNTLAVNNHMKSWYGEGDAKVWVDEDKFPSEFGTGLEDYYNTSWAPVVLYQTPWANAPRADNTSSFGHNTFTRTRNLDGIPFKRSFKYDLEMLSWNGGTIDAATTVYWYGAAGATEY